MTLFSGKGQEWAFPRQSLNFSSMVQLYLIPVEKSQMQNSTLCSEAVIPDGLIPSQRRRTKSREVYKHKSKQIRIFPSTKQSKCDKAFIRACVQSSQQKHFFHDMSAAFLNREILTVGKIGSPVNFRNPAKAFWGNICTS